LIPALVGTLWGGPCPRQKGVPRAESGQKKDPTRPGEFLFCAPDGGEGARGFASSTREINWGKVLDDVRDEEKEVCVWGDIDC